MSWSWKRTRTDTCAGYHLWIATVILAAVLAMAGVGLAASDARGVKVTARGDQHAPQASSRIALVIGNGSYRDAPLKNPANDARDVAAALEGIGFSVTLKTDADQKAMEQAISRFTGQIRRGTTALFFYAGHGMQLEGRNFLIPVGRDIQNEADVKYHGVEVGELLERMEKGSAGANIIVLDACRNNPFARSFRSAQRGLAVVTAPKNSLVIYATAAGQTAADGNGRNGLFTKHLLRHLAAPDLDIEQMLRRVRAAVQQESNGQQVPFTSSSLTSEYLSLNPGGTAESHQTPKPSSETPQAEPPREPAPGSRIVAVDGVELVQDFRPGGLLMLRLSASAASEGAAGLIWRATAKKEAERKIRKALESYLSEPPYRLPPETIERVRSQWQQVDAAFNDAEKSISLTYEVLLKIQ